MKIYIHKLLLLLVCITLTLSLARKFPGEVYYSPKLTGTVSPLPSGPMLTPIIVGNLDDIKPKDGNNDVTLIISPHNSIVYQFSVPASVTADSINEAIKNVIDSSINSKSPPIPLDSHTSKSANLSSFSLSPLSSSSKNNNIALNTTISLNSPTHLPLNLSVNTPASISTSKTDTTGSQTSTTSTAASTAASTTLSLTQQNNSPNNIKITLGKARKNLKEKNLKVEEEEEQESVPE